MAVDDDGADATVDTTVDASGATIFHLAGELDISSVPDIEAGIDAVLDQAGPRVVFDLTGLTFMDSSGIAMLLRIAEHTELSLRDASRTVRSIIDAAGLADVLRLDS
jgi:anti-anti-sigma factor